MDYVALDSVESIISYCEIHAIRAAYVSCRSVPNEPGGRVYLRELVGFDTADKGLLILDPELHREVRVEVGYSYSGLNGLSPSPYDDTIGKVSIVW
jgi:hypothetical protein